MAENESYPTLDEATDHWSVTNICHQYTFEAEDKNQAKSYREIFTMRNKSKKKILISMLEAPMFTVIEKVFSIFSGC